MKKKSFLSGIGAKLALAAVALTTVVFTSCEKEEFNVEPIEQAPASATILASVYDQTTGENLGTQTTTIAAGENGTIAKQKVTVTCPFSSAEYLPVASIDVEVPEVAKGQMILIPVNFYALKITSAATTPIISKGEENTNIPVKENPAITFTAEKTSEEITYKAWVGSEILNIDDVEASIDQMFAARTMTNEEVAKVLKSVVNSFNNMKQQDVTETVTGLVIGTKYEFKPTTKMVEYIMSIKTTVDGVEYTIPNVKVKEAGVTSIERKVLDHGHGHGANTNSGGGAGSAH